MNRDFPLGWAWIAILLIILIIVGPFIVIWAWNILFGAYVAVGYSIETWFAVMVLLGAIHSPTVGKSK